MIPTEALSTAGDWDIVGKSLTGLVTALAFGIALFLRQKFMEKKAEKSENPLMQEWLREFLTAMTEDRRQSALMYRELASEIRGISDTQRRLSGHIEDSIKPSLARIESHTGALLQRSK